MAQHDEEGDDRSWSGAPLPPEDRVWRHPSELAGGTAPPAAWIAPAPPSRRPTLALAGACLTGAALACGALWLTRPGWVSEDAAPAPRARVAASTTVASYAAAGVPTVALADALAPHLVEVEAKVDGTWQAGTGVLIADGTAVTVATPLVQGAVVVTVTVAGRREVAATPLGADPATSTTVLALAEPTTAPDRALLASPARSGQAVAVIGARRSAVGADRQRVIPTSVSAAGVRTTVGDVVLHDAIELDRTLPADALGAAVVDATGHVVGVVVDVEGADGMAVAAPGQPTLVAAADLADDGQLDRAWLGVEAVDVDPAVASVLGIDGGALLTSVDPSSPAATAGLREGDVITAVGDVDVHDASDLVIAIRAGRPGDDADVRWHRGAASQHAIVVLGG